MSQSTEAQCTVEANRQQTATQNQSQDRTKMQKFARQVNQRPMGEILLEKKKEKR
jgi:hypothetical protein